MRTAIRKHWLDFVAIIGLILISGAVAVFILGKQRLSLPAWVPVVGKDFFVIKAELARRSARRHVAGAGARRAAAQPGQAPAVQLERPLLQEQAARRQRAVGRAWAG